MIDVTITTLPAAPLHAFEIWSNAKAVAKRFKAATGFALPKLGQAAGDDGLLLIRYEPTVWLVEGDVTSLVPLLEHVPQEMRSHLESGSVPGPAGEPARIGNGPGADGALTAIGGGIVRVALIGPGWRRLLMEGGVFDAESPGFAPGCSAATIIDHVNVRLHVTRADACTVYVPASYAQGLIHFWETAAQGPA